MSAPVRTEPATKLRFLDSATDTLGCAATWPVGRFTHSEIVDMLRHFGFQVLDHTRTDAGHRFTLDAHGTPTSETLDRICAAFAAATVGATEIDAFSGLILRENVGWREVDLIRAAVRFLLRAGLGVSTRYVLDTLASTPGFATALARHFDTRFRPGLPDRDERSAITAAELRARIDAATTFDADRILRALASFVDATVRTNWYQRGGTTPYAAFKLDSSTLTVGGPIVPAREIFVSSRDVEGVHVRAELVARGGLRFSERPEDYRTEALSLMKTQAVKNAPVVPGGAKGAFVVRRGSEIDLRTAYRTFVSGLLDVVDNIAAGQVVTPADTVCYDGPDSYLVVAADKGTATMSDVANAIAAERGYWLGDAFASGGSAGYDHKAMGITARGAWVAVRQRFAEIGVDVENDAFSVAGIGDMSGDVFGNGMLCSRTIRLVAAFDHRHVFLDPAPDADASYRERARLFALPRSSWADYDPTLISAGGGVWPRSAKTVPLSAEARAALRVSATELSPDEVIRAILTAPVDLLWNGGVGTYVRASDESDNAAADPANERVRVEASQLRARVVGEGGNLGFTQRARIEFASGGGRIDADFVDNAAGVATSDREVNLKIAVDTAVARGAIAASARNALLAAVQDDVAEAVLTASRDQALALGASEHHSVELLSQHERLIVDLERDGRVDRAADGLPSAEEIERRARAGQGLTRPELAVLLAQSKNVVAAELSESGLPDAPVCESFVHGYFPAQIRDNAGVGITDHPLRRSIIVAALADELINRVGPGALYRLEERLGASTSESAAAYLVVSRVLGTEQIRDRMLATETDALARVRACADLAALLETEMGRLLRRGRRIDAQASIAQFSGPVAELLGRTPSLADCAGALAVVITALELGAGTAQVAAIRDEIVTDLGLGWLLDALARRKRGSHWEAMGRAAVRDEIADRVDGLVCAQLSGEAVADRTRLVGLLEQLRTEDRLDIARASVVSAELLLLSN